MTIKPYEKMTNADLAGCIRYAHNSARRLSESKHPTAPWSIRVLHDNIEQLKALWTSRRSVEQVSRSIDEHIDAIRLAVEKGQSPSDVACRIGFSRAQVLEAAQRHGIRFITGSGIVFVGG
jgi:hypothetical protein